jgi:UDP-N-acetylmuramoylalanine--D-glutamate ligase
MSEAMSLRDVRNKKVVILGLARSGLAAASLLLRHGAAVAGSDLQPREALSESLVKLEQQGFRAELGRHPEALLRGADFVLVSPGVPLDIPLLKHAREAGLPVYGELEVASWFCPASIVAVTGSNGKTTTTTLLGSIFRRAGWEVEVAGNIGSPFSAIADGLSPQGIAVLEVSSFQLETIETFRPETSVLLNVSPDHLDRYSGYEAYMSAKMRIFENQDAGDTAILNADDPGVMTITENIIPQKVFFRSTTTLDEGVYVSGGLLLARLGGKEQDICRVDDIPLPGPHNLSNVAAAAAVALRYDVNPVTIQEAIVSFPGIEHRLEWVDEIDGIAFVNDSKATNVVSVQYALQSFQRPIVLIAGGREKGTDFRPLRPFVTERVKLLVLLGEAAPTLRVALGGGVDVAEAESMAEAVNIGFEAARRGDVVLLSPACASFDMYENYEERGADFKNAVRALAGGEK